MAFWRTYYHLVWATKNRAELISPSVESHLFPYLTSKAAESQVHIHALGGWFDHIHLVVSIPPKHSVATVVKRLKGSSSHFLNQSGLLADTFAWQRGYGVFTLGETQLSRAEAYVRRQKEHHGAGTTNPWLEMIEEFDEEGEEARGESGPGPMADRVIRDERGAYRFDEPFP